jgi:hypothetical protein
MAQVEHDPFIWPCLLKALSEVLGQIPLLILVEGRTRSRPSCAEREKFFLFLDKNVIEEMRPL